MMSAAKDDRDRWTRPTPEDLAGVTVTIEGPEQVTVCGRRPSRSLVPKVVEIALENNRRPADIESPSGQVEFEIRGRERLIDLAAHFSPLLETHAKLQEWNRFFQNLALLASCIADSVFVRHGAETACEVALFVPGELGLRLKSEARRASLETAIVDCVKSEDTARLALLLQDSFEPSR